MIEELENKINILSAQNEKLKAENEYLKERCKNEYEGFIAVVHELCDTAMELDKYKSKCEEAIEFIKIFKCGMPYTEWVKKEDLLIILNGDDDITQYIKEALNGDDEE